MIYFIACSAESLTYVKIGYTAVSVESRLSSLQSGSPFHLQILASFEGGREDEKRIHQRFAKSRFFGEWFVKSPEIVSFLRDLTRIKIDSMIKEILKDDKQMANLSQRLQWTEEAAASKLLEVLKT